MVTVTRSRYDTTTLDARLPITREAHDELMKELRRTEEALRKESLLGARSSRPDSDDSWTPANADLTVLNERLDSLRRAEAAVAVASQDGRVIIGSRVAVELPREGTVTYELVAPGMSDLRLGRISVDSPLGTALLRRLPGAQASYHAPAGQQRLTVIRVE